jgi:hypothetical protein
VKKRPYRHKARKAASREEIVVETPLYTLSVFKVHFGALTFKGSTKGVPQYCGIEAIVHNTRDLGCGRVPDKFAEIVLPLRGLLQRFLNVLRGVDPSAHSLAGGSGQTGEDYGPTRAAYDLKKLPGKNLIVKGGNSRPYTPEPQGLRAMAALSVLREKVLKPLLAGVTSRQRGPQPAEVTRLDAR